jgi:hypothetical protein
MRKWPPVASIPSFIKVGQLAQNLMGGITQAYCSMNTKYIYDVTVPKKSEEEVKHGIARRMRGNCIATCHPQRAQIILCQSLIMF